MKLSRRAAAIATAGASAVALTLAGCSAGGGTPSGEDTTTPITLTVATFNNFGYTQALADEYHQLHPNITVKWVVAKTSDDAQANLDTKLAAGSGLSDIEAVDGDWMPKYKQYPDKFVDLAAADNADRYADWKMAGGTVNGKVIGLGTDIGPEAICYHADLFKAAGLPTDPADVAKLLTGDWNHYFQVGQQFQQGIQAAGVDAAWFDSAGATFQGMANQYANFFEKDDGTIVATDNPDVKAVFTQVLQASATESAHLKEWTDDWTAGLTTSKWATMLCPAWMVDGVIKAADKSGAVKDWNIANVFPNGGGNWGGSYLLVPAQGAHTAEAAALADWLTAPEQQLKAFAEASTFPSQTAAYTDSSLTGAKDEYFNNAPIGQIMIDRAKGYSSTGVTAFKGVNYGAIMTAVQNGLLRVEQGQQSIDDSWAQVVTDIKALG